MPRAIWNGSLKVDLEIGEESRPAHVVDVTERLRRSLEARGVKTGEERPNVMAKAQKAVPDGYHTITALLTLDKAAQTIEWYKKALGAEEPGRHRSPDGKVAHAELRIGDSRCDALFDRAVAAGARNRRRPDGAGPGSVLGRPTHKEDLTR